MGQKEWEGALAVALGGDGSVATNGFWSALTIATTLKLPMLFFIEDNGYGLSVPGELQTPGANIAENLGSFRRTSELIQEAVQYVRGGAGPCLLHLRVPRLMGHTFIDNQAYRSEEELAVEHKRDPVHALEELLGKVALDSLRESAERELEQALEEARALPEPDPETAADHLFYEGKTQKVGGLTPELGPRTEPIQKDPITSGPRVNLLDAIRTVMASELQANPRAPESEPAGRYPDGDGERAASQSTCAGIRGGRGG
jgi:2-oxoisovalerate dehydrogenase E1 component